MILINSKSKIKKFDINSNIFLFTDGELSLVDVNDKVDSFVIFDNEILIIYNKEKKPQLNLPNIPYNFGYKQFSASKCSFILYDRESLDLETFTHTKEAIYSISKKKIIYQGLIIGDRIFNNYVVGGIGYSSQVTIRKLPSGEITSIFPLSKLETWKDGQTEKPYQVSEFCDIYKNTLISTMTNGDILLLDIEKGQQFKLLKNTRIKDGLFQKEENSPIYIGLKFKTYIELNVEKGEIIKQIDLEEYFKQKFNRSILTPINTTIYKNGLIYFIADTNIVGIFNPDKLEVIDYYEFQFKNWQIMLKGGKENLQVKDNEIYCLDNQNNLYTLSSSLKNISNNF